MTDDVDPADAEKVYGALSSRFIRQTDSPDQRVVDNPEYITAEELRELGFRWGDYVDECLEYLVNVYDGVEKKGDGYAIRELQQDKHLQREKQHR